MTPRQKPQKAGSRRAPHDDPEQSRSFIEKAREIGADKDASATDQLMDRLAKMPPDPRKQGKK
jgi:hypothetical protein